MPNDSRNDKEPPCYLDAGLKLFPEAPDGQRLDLTDPTWRDQDLTKHIIRETQQQGMQPVHVYLLDHRDVVSGSQGTAAPQEDSATRSQLGFPYSDTDVDFYGDGGSAIPNQQGQTEPTDAHDFYHEKPVKVFNGPFEARAEYQPAQVEDVLTDFGRDQPVNDQFFFLLDDAVRIFGRPPQVGDLIERFDGLIFEILKSQEFQAEHFEWLYQQCTAHNTQKKIDFFRQE